MTASASCVAPPRTSGSTKLALRTIAVAAVLLAVGCDPAAAAITGNTFGSTGTIRAGGHVGSVTLVLTCEAGGWFAVDVTVTQADIVAVGRQLGRCTGDPSPTQ